MRLGAGRFVAGETLDECIVVLRRLNDRGLVGEHDAARRGRARPPPGRSRRRRLRGGDRQDRVGEAARERRAEAHAPRPRDRRGARLRERAAPRRGTPTRTASSSGSTWSSSSSSTRRCGSTGGFARRRHSTNVGTVLQAYLYRTPADLEALLPLEPNLRLVKGAYLEPAAIAYPDKSDVDAAYERLLERMLAGGGHTAIATHDERLIEWAIASRRAAGHPARPVRVPDALRRPAATAGRPRAARLQGARRDAVRAGVVPVPHAPPRRAPREPACSSSRTRSAARDAEPLPWRACAGACSSTGR